MKLNSAAGRQHKHQDNESRNRSGSNDMLFVLHSWVDFVRPIYLPRTRGLRRNTKGQLGLERKCECFVFGKLQVSKSGGIILGRSGKVPSLPSFDF